MFQAILVKYHGPTNTRGSRMFATCDAGSLSTSWDYALNADENALEAARALCHKFGWNPSSLVGGGLPNGDRCFVFTSGVGGK